MTRTSAALTLAAVMLSDLCAASAEGPVHIRSVLDITLPQPELSALCGFVVLRHIDGATDVELFLNDDGTPFHEIDTSPSLRNTYFSPDTGKAVSYPGTGSAMTDYFPDGTAVVTLDGFLRRVQVPGGAPLLIEVGRVVFSAHVVGTSPDGVPLTGGPFEVLFDAGVMRGSVLAACEALSP